MRSFHVQDTSNATIADGDCIIDIDYVGGVGDTDLGTYKEIGRMAELIIFDCVFEPEAVHHGGIAAVLGKSKGGIFILNSS